MGPSKVAERWDSQNSARFGPAENQQEKKKAEQLKNAPNLCPRTEDSRTLRTIGSTQGCWKPLAQNGEIPEWDMQGKLPAE